MTSQRADSNITRDEPPPIDPCDETTWDQEQQCRTDLPHDAQVVPPNSPQESNKHPDCHPHDSGEACRQAGSLSHDDRNPVDVLADEFARRLRAGEFPSLDEYVRRYPEHAAEIRAIFPAIAMLEGGGQSHRSAQQLERRVQRLGEEGAETLGDFRIVREIGRGGMGIVFEAEQQSLHRRVALKVLHPSVANSDRQRVRFQREAESAARLHHTNIVPVFAIGEELGFHFYAMQFIDGLTLSSVISKTKCATAAVPTEEAAATVIVSSEQAANSAELTNEASRPSHRSGDEINGIDFQPASTSQRCHEHDSQAAVLENKHNVRATTDRFRRAASIALQAAQALSYAHLHGMLHRDIKPANLMLDAEDNVWITDFGLVKLADLDDLTGTGDLVGTVRYMAPEQLEGKADQRTDVFSLGLTLFELCTLRPAFEGDQNSILSQRLKHQSVPAARSLSAAVPRDLETIIAKATAHEPRDRYQTATELAEDLQRYLDDRPILARRETLLGRARRWSRRNPALAALTTISFFALMSVAVIEWRSRVNLETALSATDVQRRRAEANVDLAVDAFDSILNNVTSRGVPSSLALDASDAEQDLSRASLTEADALLLDQLLGFYRRFAEENSDNAQLAERIAVADFRAGSILVRLGQLAEAQTHYRRAVTSLEAINATHPHDAKRLAQAVQIHNELGLLSLRRGDFIGTMNSHLDALALLLDEPAAVLSDPAIRFEQARATDFFASIDIRSGTDQGPNAPNRGLSAPDSNRRAGPLFGFRSFGPRPALSPNDRPDGPRTEERRPGNFEGSPPVNWPPSSGAPNPFGERLPDDPSQQRRQRAIAQTMPSGLNGNVLENLKQVLLNASEKFRELAAEQPENTQYRFALAQCLRHRLVHAATMNDPETAQATFAEAVSILEQLSHAAPSEPRFVFELADTLTQASRAQTTAAARVSLQRAVDHAQQLTRRFPLVSEYSLLLGTALARRAANEQARSELVAAEASLREAITTLTPIGSRFPDQGVIQIPLAKTRQQLGDLLREIALKQTDSTAKQDGLRASISVLQAALADFDRYHNAVPKRSAFNGETLLGLRHSLTASTQLLEPAR